MMPRKLTTPAPSFEKEGRTMNKSQSLKRIAEVSVLVLAFHGVAIAAEARKTPLVCTVRAGAGEEHQIDIRNSAGHVFVKDTIINYGVKWTRPTMPGQLSGCFAIDNDLAANVSVTQSIKLGPGAVPQSCMAFVSSTIPSATHGKDGSTEVRCNG
jgi:hypothetical protein